MIIGGFMLHPFFICKIYRDIEISAILRGNDLIIQTPVYTNVGFKLQCKSNKNGRICCKYIIIVSINKMNLETLCVVANYDLNWKKMLWDPSLKRKLDDVR